MHGTLTAPRVLLTSDAVGGVWRYSLELAAGIAARGGQCTLVTMGPPPSAAQREAAQRITGCAPIDTGLPLDWTATGRRAVQDGAEAVARLARDARAHTVHLHMPALAAFDWPVPAVAVAHSCVGAWWRAVHGQTPPPAAFSWRMELMREGIARAASIIAPSAAAADVLREIYAPGRRFDVVHNGLSAPREINIARVPRVLAAGRLWDGGKNFAGLDHAAPMIGAVVDAAGPSQGPDGTTFTAAHLNLLGNLPQDELRTAMARATVFAAPSLYEPFGLAVLEAAQVGTALVLSDIPGFRELWDGAAHFVDPRDPAAWAAALRALLDAPAHAAAQGARAKARSRRYTARAMVDATLAIHRALAVQAA